jgi:hypothetical protein
MKLYKIFSFNYSVLDDFLRVRMSSRPHQTVRLDWKNHPDRVAAPQRRAFLGAFGGRRSALRSETQKTRRQNAKNQARSQPGLLVTAVDIAAQNPSAARCSRQHSGKSMLASNFAVSVAG